MVNTYCVDDRKVVGAVLLDFNSAFDVIGHSIPTAKRKCCGFYLALLPGLRITSLAEHSKHFSTAVFLTQKNILWRSTPELLGSTFYLRFQ